MTLVASWELAPPDGARRSETMRITAAADVDVFLGRLAATAADDAYVVDARCADPEDSPVVTVAVRDRWVYLTWADGGFYGAPGGDERSPRAHGGHNPVYHAGTGVAVGLAALALTRWLATGRRPDVLTWVTDDDLLARAGHGA